MPRRFVLLVAALAAVGFAACGSGSGDTASPTTAAVTSAAVATDASSASTSASAAPTTSAAASSSATTRPSTTTPPTSAATTTVAAGSSPTGFETIGITIRSASGAAKAYCLWLADSEAKREQGLMQVTSLGGRSGMIFTYPSDSNDQYWMFQTVMPLSIAFFDSTGAFVSSADMAPCTGAASTCPDYPAARPFRDAIEVPLGGLGALGIGPGSAITDRGSCPA
jgi:uncharacterized protein